MIDRPIQSIIDQDRVRIVKLIRALRKPADRDFLIYCIENAVTAAEIEHFRIRYRELFPLDDNVEDLM